MDGPEVSEFNRSEPAQLSAGDYTGAYAQAEHDTPSHDTQAGAGPDLPDRRRRACKSRRVRLQEADADSDGQDDDKYSNEMLQKRLRTLTDEKEIKRLKRLLRNRVSAQQARERKKQYINDLEDQMKDKDKEIEALNAKLQEISADNSTLRRLIVTMRGTSQPVQKVAAGTSGSRMGRPLRQEVAPANEVPSSQLRTRAHQAEQHSSEGSQENGAQVPQLS